MPAPSFDAVAERYDEWCATPLGALTMACEEAALDELLPARLAGMRVLDVGCGTGTWALGLARRGALVHGVDVSEPLLRVARRKAEQAGVAVTFLAADAARLPFPDGSFDLVTALLVLEFAERPGAVATEMARVLAPGGAAIVAALNRRSLWTVLRRLSARRRRSVYADARFLTRAALAAMLREAGLRPVAFRAAVFYPPVSAAWAMPLLRLVEGAGRRGLGAGPAFLAVKAGRI